MMRYNPTAEYVPGKELVIADARGVTKMIKKL